MSTYKIEILLKKQYLKLYEIPITWDDKSVLSTVKSSNLSINQWLQVKSNFGHRYR